MARHLAVVSAAALLLLCINCVHGAPGACVDLRCYNTLPSACCPSIFSVAEEIGATREQAMTLPLEQLQVGALNSSCTANCTDYIFGVPSFPNFIQSCLTTQGFFTSTLQQVYQSSGSLCNAHCAIMYYANAEGYGPGFRLLDLLSSCRDAIDELSTGEELTCSTECRLALLVVRLNECRGRLAQVTTFGLGPTIARAYDTCGIEYDSDPPPGEKVFVSAAPPVQVLALTATAAVAAAALLL